MPLALLYALLLTEQSLYYQRGVASFQAGRLDEAANLFRQELNRDRRNAAAWKGLGAVYAAKGEFDQAEQPFEKACELKPELPDACYYLGRNRYTQNKFKPALEALEKALRYDRRPARVHVAIGQCLEALGRLAEAERAFTTATKTPGKSPDAQVAYGVFLFRCGRPADAVQPLQAAVNDYPQSAEAQLELGRTLYTLGKSREALEHLQRAVSLDPDSAPAHLLLGKVLVQTGKDAEGERHLELGRGLERQH